MSGPAAIREPQSDHLRDWGRAGVDRLLGVLRNYFTRLR